MTPPTDSYNPSLDLAAEIRKLIPRLPKHSPLRDLAQALLDGNAPPLHSKSQLISWLENPPPDSYGPLTKLGYWREKVVAAWILGQLPLSDDQIPQLGRAFCQGLISNASFDQGILRLGLTSSVLLPALAIILNWITYLYPDLTEPEGSYGLFFLLLGPVIVMLLSVPLNFQIEANHYRLYRRVILENLGKLSALESIEALLQASQNRDLVTHCYAGLNRLLPKLTKEHYGQLQAHTVPDLCRLLRTNNKTLMMNILKALGKVGDGRAVRPVEDLMTHENDPDIRSVAEAILPILQERQRLAEAPRNLLRASEQPTATPEVLLRPAMDTGDSQPEQLLRTSASAANAE